jgi:1-acyl-sn-glycerol-3-phosphate acyltransferase
MKLLKTLLLKLYAFWVFLVFTVFMIILLPGMTIPFFFGNRFSWIGYRFLWFWSWIFSQLTFIRYKIQGRENLKKGMPYILVSNHTSFLDIPGMCLLIAGEFRPLAKKELLKIPVFGWIARGATVIVDRSSGESKKRSMERLKDTLAHGIPILLFAEGTQNRTKEILQPFKDGAFKIAVDMQQPILPIVIIGAGPLMPPGTINMKPGLITIKVGKEILTQGVTNSEMQNLKEHTFQVMKEMIAPQS